jgi:hypothetical protein
MNATKINLTPKQAYVLRGIIRNGYTGYRAEANALVRKGLIHSSLCSYDRYEWGRKVASLPKYTLTAAGCEVAESRADELKSLADAYISRNPRYRG